MRPSPSPSPPPADLTRLRIQRAPGELGRLRAFNPLWLFLLLGLGGAAFLFRDELKSRVSGSGGSASAVRTGKALKVNPSQAQEGDVASAGYVVADRTASVASVISGRLVELNAQEGSIVEKDAVVARVQYDDLEAQEAEAKARTAVVLAQVEQARRAITAAEMDVPRLEAERLTLERLVAEAQENAARLTREVERNRPLVPGTVPADVFDRLEAQMRAAERALEAARARVSANQAAVTAWGGEIQRRRAELSVSEASLEAARKAELSAAIQVEKTRIRAPFRGLVIRKDAERGEVIAPTGGGANSKGSVLTIVDPESFEMQVELNEKRIARVAEGDAALIKLDAYADRTFPGKVRKIWPRADRSKGTIEVRVVFVERPEGARPDMAGQVIFQGKQAPAAALEPAYVTVPAGAVVKRAGKDVVFVVEGGLARQVAVTLGAPKGSVVVVAAGLEGGETVVLSPSASLVDGERVGGAP